MTEYRHTIHTIASDYIRAAFGLAVTVGPVLFLQTIGPVYWTLIFLVSLFIVYTGNVIIRHVSVIELSITGIVVSGPFSRSMRWQDIEEMRLRHFSTRRDGRRGWLQLVLKGGGVKIRIESTLSGFADIVKCASKAASDRGLDLSPTTLGNLELLGETKELFTPSSDSQ
ncbi:MAG: hypothetical protein VX700_03790 [Pseudomonadota bacterium]|nr:hypothetical protein [Pseudomonadota bacterium]